MHAHFLAAGGGAAPALFWRLPDAPCACRCDVRVPRVRQPTPFTQLLGGLLVKMILRLLEGEAS